MPIVAQTEYQRRAIVEFTYMETFGLSHLSIVRYSQLLQRNLRLINGASVGSSPMVGHRWQK